MPAQAVPCPTVSPSSSSSTIVSPSAPSEIATAPSTSPTSGCPASMPLSTMQTRAPAPVEPPQAHSRVTRSGQRRRQRDRVDARRGQAPGGKLLVFLFVLVRAQGAHRDACPAPCKDRTVITCERCGRESSGDDRFCASCGAPLAPQARAGGAEGRDGPLRRPRRFTARAEQLDPEDVRAVLAPFYARLRAELERFGGTVEKFIGDAVMAVFGAPVAHEDDPERAVRAALAIRDWAARGARARGADRGAHGRGARLARCAPGRGRGHGRRRRRQHGRPDAGGGAGERHPRRRADLPRDGPRRSSTASTSR